MKIKILYFLIICMGILLAAGCEKDKQRESPEHAVEEIIYYYNNGEIHNFWNRILPQDRYSVSKNMIENINNQDLYVMMGYALDKDNMTAENISAEEYLYGIFKVVLGDKSMELINVEQIDENTYNANIRLGEKIAIMPLVLVNNKWYMKIQ